MKVRRKPVEVEAIQFFSELKCHIEGLCACLDVGEHWEFFGSPHIHTLEGIMHVSDGDWIITGVKGEHYPCKPDIFDLTYEIVKEEV